MRPDGLEAIMLLAFIAEMSFRFLAMGFRKFVDDGMHVLLYLPQSVRAVFYFVVVLS